MELSVNVDLTFSDVTSEVGDRMSDVIVWHSQDGNLSDGSISALHTTGSLEGERESKCSQMETCNVHTS